MLGQKKLPLKIIKNNIKFELRDYKIYEDLLYINNKLYISNNPELRIKIIEDIYNSPLSGHADKLFTYNRFFHYYY